MSDIVTEKSRSQTELDAALEEVEDLDARLSIAIRKLMALTARASPEDRAYVEDRYQDMLRKRTTRFEENLRSDMAKEVEPVPGDKDSGFVGWLKAHVPFHEESDT